MCVEGAADGEVATITLENLLVDRYMFSALMLMRCVATLALLVAHNPRKEHRA